MPASRRGSTVIPTLSYRDAPAMIDWLVRAFGFQKQAVYMDGDVVLHAQLTWGDGMIMLGSSGKDGDWAKLMAQPDEIGGRSTHGVCVIVTDPDAHYAHAKTAGATIVIDIADQHYGGRGYAARDPEGYVWWFGSYDPWNPEGENP
ncbi:VOC family protein [Lysobacter sp. MMG2]|uniref:VOC family protein n=1 Tax=Lysobacter sp. MMG2 TaxID=2801338 RepID=UPI001C232F6F|nr:VOC family protein [Lysobacter sp. MMG2]MBU8975215.1 VOC family protein [Lysobacter sp. MMG2]